MIDLQPIGEDLVETKSPSDRRGEQRKSAGNERRMGAMGTHRGDQRLRAGVRRQTLDKFLDGRHVNAGEKGDARGQRGFEVDFPTHRRRRERGHLFPLPDRPRQFVETFLRDHCRIHVRDEQRLAAKAKRLHNHVNGPFAEGLFDPWSKGWRRVGGGEVKVESDASAKPSALKAIHARRGERPRGRVQSECLAGRRDKSRDQFDSGF